jgi:starch synthase
LYYDDKKTLTRMRKHMMEIDNSWEKSVQQYLNIYLSLK